MGSVFLNMKYKIIYIILLMLGNATLFCEINKMDDFVVKADKPNTKIECNLLLSLNHSAESAGTELFFINKIKISNKEGSVSRCYIIDGDQNQSEITNTDNIYSFDERHRHSILKVNHSNISLYAVLENRKIQKEINMKDCVIYYNELIKTIKNTKKKESALGFLSHLALEDKSKTTADEIVLISDDLDYLVNLRQHFGGHIKGHALRINNKLLNSKINPPRFLPNKIKIFFPWRSGIDLPQIQGQQVYYPLHTFQNRIIGEKSRILVPIISEN